MNVKKMLAGAMALTVVMSMTAMTSLAAPVADATIDPDRTGSLTVYKYDLTTAEKDGAAKSFVSTGKVNEAAEAAYADYAIQGVEFTYLKVGTLETRSVVGADGKTQVQLVYGMDSTSQSGLSSIGVKPSDAIETKGGLSYYASDTLVDTLAESLLADEVATKNNLENFVLQNGGTTMAETNANGKTSVSGLAQGLYLVVETAVPEDVVSSVNPFFVSLPMTDNEGDHWIYDVTVYPKNQTGDPDLTKEVAEVTSAAKRMYSDTATASDGDTLAYQIVSNLPKITSQATYLCEYTFVDTLSKGITYKKNDVVLTWQDEAGNALFTWNQNDTVKMFEVAYADGENGEEIMTISLTDTGLAAINPKASLGRVIIDYEAVMNSDASVIYGDLGNANEVELTWKRTNMTYFDQLQDDCVVYTYGIDLTKSFLNGGNAYGDVKFKVQNVTDGYYVTAVKAEDGLYYVTGTVGAAEAAGTVFSPDANGKLYIYGLENDAYVMTEIETAAGYTLLKDDIAIEIVSTKDAHSHVGSATVNGDAVAMLEVEGSANAMAPLTVVNEKTFDIPMTGDNGLFWLPILGCLGGAVLLVVSTKKARA